MEVREKRQISHEREREQGASEGQRRAIRSHGIYRQRPAMVSNHGTTELESVQRKGPISGTQPGPSLT